MDEAFLHHVWMFKRFNHDDLFVESGQRLKIIDYGFHNKNAGPDFLNACIIIGKTKWFGHIEIHKKSTDWFKHKHETDPSYNNVILHVVFEYCGDVHTEAGTIPSSLSLNTRIATDLINNYRTIFNNRLSIPCQHFLKDINGRIINIFLESLSVKRLERKCNRILNLLDSLKYDWEQCCYVLLLKYIGGKVNQGAFELLSKKLPYGLISRYCHDIKSLECLLLGQAGLIGLKKKDEYLKTLEKEYKHLARKHTLTPMTGLEWRFATLRPQNSPALRIAQLAFLYSRQKRLFSKLVQCESLKECYDLLDCKTSAYWEKHFIPGRRSRQKPKYLGKQTKTVIIINAFIPLLFAKSKLLKNEKLMTKSLELLSSVKPERNNIIDLWRTLGINPENSSQTQALIELKTQYCDQFKCLNCTLGTKLLLNA